MKSATRWKAVTLDVGGTLVEPWPSVGAVYAEAAARAGLGDFDPAVLDRRFGEAWRARGFFDYSRGAWAGLVEATFRGLTPRADDARLFAALYGAFAQPGAWRIFPDVRPTLTGLRAAGVRLGIISNWDQRLGALLRDWGLAEAIDLTLISAEAGFHKPDPRLFARAVDHWGCAPDDILHVGDSPGEDVAGAESAGLRALLLDRAGRPGPGRLACLTDLLPVITGNGAEA